MPARKPDWGTTGNRARKWWKFGGKKTPAVHPEPRKSESEMIAEWVREARGEKDASLPKAHKRKPLFRSSNEAYSSGDKMLFTSGIALSLICAFFPWYVFLNQDQFGVRTVQLGDIPASGGTPVSDIRAVRLEAPIATEDAAERFQLDSFTTGTLPDGAETDPLEPDKPAEPREQPFPKVEAQYSLVHVANGRAMFEDDSGLFIVQPNSVLPDNSRVMSIERRAGQWVVVTNKGRVFELPK